MILGLIDPFLLLYPSGSSADVAGYARRLLMLQDLRQEQWIQLIVSGTTTEALAESNGFPPWNAIKSTLSHQDLGIDAKDVIDILTAILTKLPTIETVSRIRDVLVSDSSFSLGYCTNRGHRFEEELSRLLCCSHLYLRENQLEGNTVRLITADAPCPHALQYCFAVLDVEREDNGESSNVKFPYQITDTVSGMCCYRQVLRSADPLSFWQSSTARPGFKMAIQLYCQQRSDRDLTSLSQWTLGRHFSDSIVEMHLNHRVMGEKILRACYETITGQNLQAVHALRSSVGGASKQVKRGARDLAFRRDIDDEWHLHYWSTGDGPELASVVSHNVFSIP